MPICHFAILLRNTYSECVGLFSFPLKELHLDRPITIGSFKVTAQPISNIKYMGEYKNLPKVPQFFNGFMKCLHGFR